MLKEGYTLPFQSRPSSTRSPKNYQLLCTSSQEPKLVRSITSAYGQRMVQSNQFKISGLLHPFLVPKPHHHWRPILGLSKPNLFGDHQDHPPTMGVGYLNRFQGRLLPYTNTGTVQDIEFHVQGRTYPFKALSFGLSTAPMELTVVARS